jgi:amino acid transporter
MFGAVTLITISYIVPVYALSRTGMDPTGFTTGAWVQAATRVGGEWLGFAIVVGGMICGIGMANALVLSYSRVPFAMAHDGMMPKWMAKVHPKTGAPWVSIVVCSLAWIACLPLGFDKLIAIDIMVYTVSLLLEFAALIALRVREPELARPFKIKGGIPALVLLSVGPAVVLTLALVENGGERAGPFSTLTWGAMLLLAGVAVYFVTPARRAAVRAREVGWEATD